MDSTQGRRGEDRSGRGSIVIVLLAALVGVGLVIDAKVRRSNAAEDTRRALSAGSGGDPTDLGGGDGIRSAPGTGVEAPSLQPALLAATLRDLRLVTVRIDHTVVAQAGIESWRGDVRAEVSGNATSLYGVDLSLLKEGDIEIHALTGEVTVRVPAPARIATEISTPAAQLSSQVQVGWGRLRDVAGEYYLGVARSRLHEAAREQALSPEQREQVRSLSREQVGRLVSAIVNASHRSGSDRQVHVEFIETEVGGEAGGRGEAP